jgi:hypothetical protein
MSCRNCKCWNSVSGNRIIRLREDGIPYSLPVLLEETGFIPLDLGGLIDGGRLQQFGGPLNALHLNLLDLMEF